MMLLKGYFDGLFVTKKINIRVMVGHCERGGYLVVPDILFGTNTIYFGEKEYDFQLLSILEHNISRNVVTQEMVDMFNKKQFDHIVKHPSNGHHVLKFHWCDISVVLDTLNDEALAQYNSVVEYIILRQRWHDEKMHIRWKNDIVSKGKGDNYYGCSGSKYEANLDQYRDITKSYLQARIKAKWQCKTIERFESMIRYYWSQENAKAKK